MYKFSKLTSLGTALLIFGAGCAPTETQPVPQVETAEVYFVMDTPQGLRLVSEVREFEVGGDSIESVVLDALVSGELQPLDPDYFNLWAQPNELLAVNDEGGSATVDLKPVTLNVGAEGEAAAINQIVWTLTGLNQSLTEVSFLVNGKAAESLAGHVDSLSSLKRGLEYEVLSGIQISSALDGDELMNPVTITGEACTFEANVRWVLMQAETVVDEGSTLAAEACPTRSAWSVDLGTLSPGIYNFLAQDFSMKDGSLVLEESKTFEVK